MKFVPTALAGAYVVEMEPVTDERGFFARSWCRREFDDHGLNSDLVQCNVSYNRMKGTLRGMHYQAAPHEEVKLVRCTQGAICDVLVDLRPDSPTYCSWISVELTAANRRMLYVPAGLAHGFQTLRDDSEVFYQMSAFYDAASARGVRWNDPAFGIEWPFCEPVMSAKDANYPDFADPQASK
jgi:dTDP-4-dehydrorhamnose 3,5-epimerase